METKTKIGLFIAQITILIVFICLAMGSGGSNSSYPSGGGGYSGGYSGGSYSSGSYSSSSSSSRSDHTVRAIRAALQGGICGGNGFTYIGTYSSNSACSEACGNKGYKYYCTGEDTYACFCK